MIEHEVICAFEVPGPPVGWARTRVGHRHGKPVTPAKQRVVGNTIGILAHQAMRRQAVDGPVALAIVAAFPIPTSWTKKRQQAARDGTEQPTKKPDADNIVKLVKDALNRIVYADDKQVVQISARKVYADEPRLTVTVSAA